VKGRLPESAEIAAYYVAAEALANIAEHAHATVADLNQNSHRLRVWCEAN